MQNKIKTTVIFLLAITAAIIPIPSKAANPIVAIPEDLRIQVLPPQTNSIVALGTDGINLLYWLDGTEYKLNLLDINTGETISADLQSDISQVVTRFGSVILLPYGWPTEFIYADTLIKDVRRIDVGRRVNMISCFDGNKVGYISNSEFWVYDLTSATEQLVSSAVNGNYFFCSIQEDLVSFNDERDGESRVYLRSLESNTDILVSGSAQGRSSIILGGVVYYDEFATIHSFDIASRKSIALFPGNDVTGYLTSSGVHVLAYDSREENTLAHPVIALPQYDVRYRVGDIDRWQGIFSIDNGMIVWNQLDHGEYSLWATRLGWFDSDHDGVPDLAELSIVGSDHLSADTDGDGFDDGVELDNGYSPLTPATNSTPTGVDAGLLDHVSGRILLQVESLGEAWYVDPVTQRRVYMKDGAAAFQIMRSFGLGITNADLAKIPEHGSTQTGDSMLITRLKGRILLQVEGNGEAWYVNPTTGKRHYLRDGTAAYELMRSLGLGITNADLNKIPVTTY